jgi:hypothetical protein
LKTFQLDQDYSFELYDSVGAIGDLWDELPNQSLLLSSKYLRTLEVFHPENMSFRYVLAYKSKELIAGFYFQLLPFNAAERLQLEALPKDSLFACMYRHLKKFVARKVDFVTLICGNLLATGAFGYSCKSSVSYLEFQNVFNQILRTLFKNVECIDHAAVCLIKELPVNKKFDDTDNSPLKYFHPFFIQPSMVLNISSEWNSLEDYFSDLQSKYRLRVRKALLAASTLSHKEISGNEINLYQDKIYNLYLNTADGSDFNLVKLHKNYFPQLKTALGNRYRIFGFFEHDELIAFYSFIDDSPQLMGHFLGTMKENNIKYQVYMNILLKFIEHGIQGHYNMINLARTAIEIKSSVGAVPVEMICYLTHRNKIYNAFVPNLIQYLKPEEKYTIRQPFKKLKIKN